MTHLLSNTRHTTELSRLLLTHHKERASAPHVRTCKCTGSAASRDVVYGRERIDTGLPVNNIYGSTYGRGASHLREGYGLTLVGAGTGHSLSGAISKPAGAVAGPKSLEPVAKASAVWYWKLSTCLRTASNTTTTAQLTPVDSFQHHHYRTARMTCFNYLICAYI